MKTPFIPLSKERSRKVTRHYMGFGERLSRFFPGLGFSLRQAEFGLDQREWASLGLYCSLVYFSVVFSAVLTVMAFVRTGVLRSFALAGLSGLGIAAAVFFYFGFYPRLYVSKRVKSIERFLPHALRQLLIQVRSGMPLYNSIVSVSRKDYGPLSEEFRAVVKEIDTGRSEMEALDGMARRNPSLHLRRIMWQITNAMRTGADIGSTLKEIVDTMMIEQKVEIKNYGASLNPLALFYMMVVVIFPTLGIVFLLVMSSFVGMAFDIKMVLMGILGFLLIFQVMFIGIVKTKRPTGV
jgi:flagellar protein FlaJ